MLQRIYHMIKEVDIESLITIAAPQKQVPQIMDQLGGHVSISPEPSRKDTFPAIVLACLLLKEQGVDPDDAVAVCPIDPDVDESYFLCVKEMCSKVKEGMNSVVLMGITPSYPSEKYGYIICENDQVVSFTEKPNKDIAKEYIKQGAFWNSGVFAFKLDYILRIAQKTFGSDDYEQLYKNYSDVKKISFDYAVLEKEKNIGLVKYTGRWEDLGTWNTVTKSLCDYTLGNAITSQCSNTHVINELNIPLVAIGIHDAVIVATPDGILVSDKEKSEGIKELVIEKRPMYERREWGEYKVLDYNIQSDGNNSLTKLLVISTGKHISYQTHHHRTEMWTIIDGEGQLILDGEIISVNRGDSVTIPPLCKHAIKADKELHIIEIQIGDELSEDDINRIDYNWSIFDKEK